MRIAKKALHTAFSVVVRALVFMRKVQDLNPAVVDVSKGMQSQEVSTAESNGIRFLKEASG